MSVFFSVLVSCALYTVAKNIQSLPASYKVIQYSCLVFFYILALRYFKSTGNSTFASKNENVTSKHPPYSSSPCCTYLLFSKFVASHVCWLTDQSTSLSIHRFVRKAMCPCWSMGITSFFQDRRSDSHWAVCDCRSGELPSVKTSVRAAEQASNKI